MSLDSYEFSAFVDSIKDLGYFEIEQKVFSVRMQLETLISAKGTTKQERYRAGHLLAQLSGLRFWFATGRRPAGLSDGDFALLEPVCRSLIQKGILRPEAADIFSTSVA